MKNKNIITMVSLFLIVALGISSFGIYYWYNRHKLLFSVDSIIAYESADNENMVRFEISGKAKTWFFDFKKYDNVCLVGEESGGDIRYYNTSAKSDVFNINHKKNDFTINFDVDKTSYNWGDPVDEYIFQEKFTIIDTNKIKDYSHLGYVMFMDDYDNVDVDWQEPRKINDSLLEAENWREYMQSQGKEHYLKDYPY